MTLANMRAQGVRSLWVVCDPCHNEAAINADRFADVWLFPPRYGIYSYPGTQPTLGR